MQSNNMDQPVRHPSLLKQKDAVTPNLTGTPNKHHYHNLYTSPTKSVTNKDAPHSRSMHTTPVILDDESNPLFDHKNSDAMPSAFNTSVKKHSKVKKPKMCKVCMKPIIGTLVRAMGDIYHVDCFTCYDCNSPCSNKFFAADIQVPDPENSDISNTVNVPLCEYDYFKRIDLICHTCNNAIRGSYITALGKKYHSEHFFCEVCKKVFDSENYYANEDKIYCHYHYSKLHAYHCQSCKCAILKQYVEICRGGVQQQWHPECFMVHKFWNVDVTVNSLGLGIESIDQVSSHPDKLYKAEIELEKLTILIWLTLSEFEESSAALISEMLHATTVNNKAKGIACASKLNFKINCLFKSLDLVSSFARSKRLHIDYSTRKYQRFSNLSKEPRSLTSKIMSFLTFLRDVDPQKLATNKYSHELLSLISNIAHLIKLISRNALMHALEFNRMSNTTTTTDMLLTEISKNEDYPKDIISMTGTMSKATDACTYCNNSIEDECVAFKDEQLCDKRWHMGCLYCDNCSKKIHFQNLELSDITYNIDNNQLLCPSCGSSDVNAKPLLKMVSRYMQLAYILNIAINRSKIVHNRRDKNGHIRNHSTLEDNNKRIDSIDTQQKEEHNKKNNNEAQTKLQKIDKDAYENKVSEIARRRSQRESRKINSANREIRKSVILEAPIAWSAGTEEVNSSANSSSSTSNVANENILSDKVRLGTMGSKKLKIRNISGGSLMSRKSSKSGIRMNSTGSQRKQDDKRGPLDAVLTSKLLKNESSLTLDDIPRIVSSEQAREHRPNAFRFQKRDYTSTNSNLPIPKAVNVNESHASDSSSIPSRKELARNAILNRTSNQNNEPYNIINTQQSKNDTDNSINNTKAVESGNDHKRFSDLNFKSHEYIRHIAAYALYNMYPTSISLEESLSLIDVYKSPSFWGKLFGSSSNNELSNNYTNEFKSGSATASGSGKGVFGISLSTLISKYGVESDLGVGTKKVKIPLIVDELIHVMRTQDVSTEGVFRLNGNIRRLKQLVEEIDTYPESAPKLQNETPIQLAALLKKFLRDLPNPLLTFKLYDIFLMSQKVGDGNEDDDEVTIKKRERILKLAYAMLPQCHRDLVEVLFAFLSWVSTFANIDSENDTNGGSKMDTHNLATVITPNILYAKVNIANGKSNPADTLSLVNSAGGENQFLAIEVINDMIEMNEELSIIPPDLLALLEKLSSTEEKGKEKEKLSTKDIMLRIKTCVESNPNILQNV